MALVSYLVYVDQTTTSPPATIANRVSFFEGTLDGFQWEPKKTTHYFEGCPTNDTPSRGVASSNKITTCGPRRLHLGLELGLHFAPGASWAIRRFRAARAVALYEPHWFKTGTRFLKPEITLLPL